MVGRVQLKGEEGERKTRSPSSGGLYFKGARKDQNELQFIDSGCALLNCLSSGGSKGAWPLGRVINIIGDTSVGKTLLAIEAAHNFALQYSKGFIWYRESEGAFDVSYAESIGFPVDRVDFGSRGMETKWDTIEDIFEDLKKCVAKARASGEPGLFIVDSLDGLGSRSDKKAAEKAEKKQSDAGSYKMGKQKTMSERLADFVRDLRETRICVIFISQIRENIGVTFGKKYRRSGGKALDFYARLILWISHIEFENKERNKVKRAVGVRVRVKSSKNHLGGKAPREVEFTIRFGFGVDDVNASLDWLYHHGKSAKLGMTDKQIAQIEKLSDAEYRKLGEKIRKVTYEAWDEVEASFEPSRKKYV